MSQGKEQLVERRVTYFLEYQGRLYIIENVPARVNEQTGEQFFSPTTVEKLQQTIQGQTKPVKVIETPVYEFSE